jgi:molybdate transport system substrate-binding protein
MNSRALLRLAVILFALAAACGPPPSGAAPTSEPTGAGPSRPVDWTELDVFAAASLTEPFTDIGHMFEAAHPGVSVVFNFAGSQQLAQQINQGAPADVFASANNTQMNTVIDAGGIEDGSQQVFANNRLVVIYPKDNPAGLNQLQDLAKPGLKVVLAAPEVPVGQYSVDFLEKAVDDPAFGPSFQDDVLQNVVSYEDNVKAVLTKVALGEADAGIVYTSDISGTDAGKVGRMDIPDTLNVVATYPIATIKGTHQPELADAFVEFVLSPEGQATLAAYNFIPAVKAAGGDSSLPAGGVIGDDVRDGI